MVLRKISLTHIGQVTGIIALLATLGCEPPSHVSQREISPAAIEIGLSVDPAGLTRPAVEFDHDEHTEALKDKGCEACHEQESNAFVFKFGRTEDGDDKEALRDLYHDKCIGCHKERATAKQKTGPRTCAGCHAKRDDGITLRQEMAFDYSLHYRHVKATGDEKCDTCHHQYDETAKKLVYVKGKEDACRDCHGKVDDGKNLSLKHASHDSCITCHLRAEAKGRDAGPTLCNGCHDGASQLKYKKVNAEEIPRLERGQKEKVLISLNDAKSHAVNFDHKSHEGRAPFCTTCHHMTPKPCKECHTLTGSKEGEGVTAEQAYHLASSKRSCVGCHMKKTETLDCAGCHDLPAEQAPPSKRTCVVCHVGSPQSPLPTAPVVDGGIVEQKEEGLPPTGDDFPESVEIKTLANEYGPSKMPHFRIAKRLYESISKSVLATTFHGQTEVMCAGCHHRSPAGEKPRRCSACHSVTAENRTDKPGLKAAYHRQCMGCHESMKIEKAMGCEDCHEKAGEKEVAQ